MRKLIIASNSCWNIFHYRLPLLLALKEKDYEIIIVANDDNYRKNLEKYGFKFYEINFQRKSINPFINLLLIIKYYYIIKKIKPSLIFVFTIKPNIFLNLSQFFTNKKIINNVTGLGTSILKGKFFSIFMILLMKICFIKSEKVIFHNLDDLKYFCKNENNKYLCLPSMGINTKKFKFLKKNFNYKNRKINFIYIGRIIKDKGIIEYLKSAVEINKKYPNTIFSILGSLDEENSSSLSNDYIKYFKKFNFISFINFNQDIQKILQSQDCLILPSYREGIPRVIMESQSIGIPVISTNVAGSNVLVKNNFTGLLCKKNNVQSLVKTIEKFINLTPNTIEFMVENAKKNVITNFDEELIVNKYINLIKVYEKN